MRYFDQKHECMSADEMKKLQDERLCNTVNRVYNNVRFYHDRMDQCGLKPSDIKGVQDLHKLPFMTKADLRDNYPFGTFAVPNDQIVRIHASSGTTGKSIIVGVTKNDVKMWADCVARCLVMAGASKHDIIQVSYGYGLFTGGLGLHYGSERLGALTIPTSGGNTARQIQLMQDLGSTILCCTPSYSLFLADYIRDNNIPLSSLKLKAGVFGAEPWSELMKDEIEQRLGLKAYDIYGLSEVIGPGVAMSCNYGEGLHVNADHFYPEIINPETGEVLPEGQTGEIVFTCITKEALPMIRYRTRDLSSLSFGTCECGRTLPKMKKVIGRSDDMLIIRGVNVFPSQVESVLLSMGQVEPHYMLYVDRKGNLDELSIEVEMTSEMFSDKIDRVEAVERKLQSQIQSVLNINADVRLVAPKSIPRSEGKAKRVIDRRNLFNN
ncbi:MAG TPA: phenylacetate--CoA ligase [Oscillospiraceae bacterium]|nr:phenylacetate--CoA ligase [Oscillospiraceae bacterium]HPS34950.1 phenylacetate--CoA ligase [Oscillospiraceae bacterium]